MPRNGGGRAAQGSVQGSSVQMIAIWEQGWACLGKAQRASVFNRLPVCAKELGAGSTADLVADLPLANLTSASTRPPLAGETCVVWALSSMLGRAAGRLW